MWDSQPVKLSPQATYPVPGDQRSLNQNSHRPISPSQNTGAATKNSANPIAARSVKVRLLIAEMMPMGMPMASQIRAAPKASWTVTRTRPKNWSLTGERVE